MIGLLGIEGIARDEGRLEDIEKELLEGEGDGGVGCVEKVWFVFFFLLLRLRLVLSLGFLFCWTFSGGI